MPLDASASPDPSALAYELMIGTILKEVGFPEPGVARAWARFWLCDPADAGEVAAASRELTERLMAADLPLSVISQVHGRLATLEVRHLAAGGAAEPEAIADWVEACDARLVLLLACVEGERVCAALAPEPQAAPAQATDEAVAALREAAGLLNRRLDELGSDKRAARSPRKAA
jgi:hypothetical protein